MSVSSTHRVTSKLRDEIVTAKLAPGMHLNQSDLAERFGISRIPVRDALHALAGEGLVDLTSGGALVSAMSVADLDELYELRGLVEPRATALGIASLGRSDLRLLREAELLMQETTDPARWLEANTLFHRTMYEKSGRVRWTQLIESLRSQTDRYLHLHLTVIGGSERLCDEHAQILKAAETGDAPTVETLTREHLRSSHDFILEHLVASDRSAAGTNPETVR